MSWKNTVVFGIYPTLTGVESGVAALRAAGFRNTDISVLFPDHTGSKDFAHENGTEAPQGAVTGAGNVAVAGGALGWLVGIGALAIPGHGLFVAAGPLMAALAGRAVVGATGGVGGVLTRAGIPEYVAKRYEVGVRDGGILLYIHSDSSEWTGRAKEVLERTGAQDIASIASTEEAGADDLVTNQPPARPDTGAAGASMGQSN